MGYYDRVAFADLKGKVLVEINAGDDNISLVTSEGKSYDMYHDQDCCEHVRVESIVGDLKDLLGHPLLVAEEVSNEENPDYTKEIYDSYTWTFYKLATIKGYVDIRWLGESNGYYSESVSLNNGREYTPEEVNKLMEKNGINKKTVLSYQSIDTQEIEVSAEPLTFAQQVERENQMKSESSTSQVNVEIKVEPEKEAKEIYIKKNKRFNL